jgi:hypothetical protein
MRTTVSVPDPLLENAKQLAAKRGITLSELIEDALRNQLSQADTSSPKPFQLHTVRGKLVNPDLDLDRTSSLVSMDDESEYEQRG